MTSVRDYESEAQSGNGNEELLISKLREILLKEDRGELQRLNSIINTPDLLSAKVVPIVEERMEFVRQNFPREYKIVVNKIVDEKLRESRDELLDVLYPVLGKMIKKYISQQFQEIKDTIDKQLRNTFSSKNVVGRFKSMVFGVQKSDLMLSQIDNPRVEEIFVIQHNSGILLGSASMNKTIDQDVIAGMFTAIKAFVEDAFQREREELELIQYGTYKIVIQNFHTFYIAVAVGGSLSNTEKTELSEQLMDFANKHLAYVNIAGNSNYFEEISQKLYEYYILPQIN